MHLLDVHVANSDGRESEQEAHGTKNSDGNENAVLGLDGPRRLRAVRFAGIGAISRGVHGATVLVEALAVVVHVDGERSNDDDERGHDHDSRDEGLGLKV